MLNGLYPKGISSSPPVSTMQLFPSKVSTDRGKVALTAHRLGSTGSWETSASPHVGDQIKFWTAEIMPDCINET